MPAVRKMFSQKDVALRSWSPPLEHTPEFSGTGGKRLDSIRVSAIMSMPALPNLRWDPSA